MPLASSQSQSPAAGLIFQPHVRDGYEWVHALDSRDYEKFYGFDGTSRRVGWVPVRVKRHRREHLRALKPSDFPWLGGATLVLRQRAVDALRPLLEPHGELLPLATDDDVPLYVLNVTRIVDALDEERSTLLRIPGSDRIALVQRPVFHPGRVEELPVFRLPFRSSPTYVNDAFVARVWAARLQGLELNPVWSPPSR